jgi:CheY-like chemotaxis protein
MEQMILVVEDNLLNMELATDILNAAGYKVLQAEDAEQGLVLARSQKPALILMDVGLPGMDGLTATAMLKADPHTSRIPLIALTAHAMKGDKERALAGGCDDYLTKPIDSKTLLDAVRRFIRLNPEHSPSSVGGYRFS